MGLGLPLTAFAALAYFGVSALSSSAATAPPIYVNGQPIGVTAIVRHAQVFVPVRGVFEKLDAAVVYTPPRTVVARKANVDLVQLALGSRTAKVTGRARTLQTAPFLHGARVFVPLRLISEAAGATVVYSAAPHAVRISRARTLGAAPVALASPADTAAPVATRHGIPWWVWLLLALIVLAILFAISRRRKPDPVIATRSSPSDPTINTRR